MSSASESEIAALFINTKIIIPMTTLLHELGHPQPATTLQTDNAMAQGFATKTIKQRKSKTISMNFYWIQDQHNETKVTIFWHPKELNMADYFTKHHPPVIHKTTLPLLLHQSNSPIKPSIYHLPHAERVC